MKSNRGFTLIELTMTAGLASAYAVMLLALIFNLRNTTGMIEGRSTAADNARNTMYSLTKELRQASRASLTIGPGPAITYRIPQDLDGDGTVLDAAGNIELGAPRTIERGGLRDRQLLLYADGRIRVLGNGLAIGEDLDGDGELDEHEHGNGARFLNTDGAVEISLRTWVPALGFGSATVSLTEVVWARNP